MDVITYPCSHKYVGIGHDDDLLPGEGQTISEQIALKHTSRVTKELDSDLST